MSWLEAKFGHHKIAYVMSDKDHMSCFIAQSVEHHTGIAEVMGSNTVGASEFFLGFICNCLSYFTTAKISFTSMGYILVSSCLWRRRRPP